MCNIDIVFGYNLMTLDKGAAIMATHIIRHNINMH